jgi:hypothetical protein
MVVKIPKKLEMKSLLPAPYSPLPTHVLAFPAIGEDCDDVDTWTHAHLVRECIHHITREKIVTLRFENGDEEDVWEGAIYRPNRVNNPERKSRGF